MKWYFRCAITAFVLLPTVTISAQSESPVELHEDLRGVILTMNGKDLTQLDLRESDLAKTTFDSFTPWPTSDLMPNGFDPEALIERGKNPGLGVRQLHKDGMTGKGVHVAMIDQPLLENHIEYRDQLASYTTIQTGDAGPQMHGPAVASILAGKTCGVAPEAILHYWAIPMWKRDYQYYCEALEQILEYNKEKSSSEQIRIVSVSKGFDVNDQNLDQWETLLDEAKENGVYVVHCSRNMFGVNCPIDKDPDVSEHFQLCEFYSKPTYNETGKLFAPIDNRTTANPKGEEAYTFWSKAGLSWGAPYIAGVAALGLQIDPKLTESEIEQLLYESGSDFQNGKLINPAGFIHAVKELKATKQIQKLNRPNSG